MNQCKFVKICHNIQSDQWKTFEYYNEFFGNLPAKASNAFKINKFMACESYLYMDFAKIYLKIVLTVFDFYINLDVTLLETSKSHMNKMVTLLENHTTFAHLCIFEQTSIRYYFQKQKKPFLNEARSIVLLFHVYQN